jgi:DNA-binding MarR family transcriptional regulator
MYIIRMADVGDEVGRNAGYLVWRLATAWRAAMDRALEPLGLTQAQYAVLAPLYAMSRGGDRPSQRELADLTGLDAVYVSKLVRALEGGGFVARAASAADSRAFELSLTEQGVATVREAATVVSELRERLTKPLGGTDGARTEVLTGMLRELLAVPELRTTG